MNFATQVGFHPPKQHYPTSFRGHAKPVSSSRLGVPAGPVCLSAFRSPAGKMNSRDGRGPRQIKRRGWRRLTPDLWPARRHKPRSRAVRAAPHSLKIRSESTAGTPEQASPLRWLEIGIPRLLAPETSRFFLHSGWSEAFYAKRAGPSADEMRGNVAGPRQPHDQHWLLK